MAVEEHTIEVASSPAFVRRAPAPPGEPLPVFLHEAPTSSDDWTALLARTGGIALDLPGFGRSGKGGQHDYTLTGLATQTTAILDALEVGSMRVIGHGWGAAVALELAAAVPERVAGLTLIAPPPLTGGFTWPRLARSLRRPMLGEVIMGSVTRGLLVRYLRSGARPQTWNRERTDALWEQFDHGTQRAVLRLLRGTEPDHFDRLPEPSCPVAIIRGEMDPWLPLDPLARLARRYPDATVTSIPDAGHWPQLDRADALAALV